MPEHLVTVAVACVSCNRLAATTWPEREYSCMLGTQHGHKGLDITLDGSVSIPGWDLSDKGPLCTLCRAERRQ